MPDLPIFLGNGTLNKHSGIDFKQLNFLAKLNENHSGEVTLPLLAPPSLNAHKLPAVHLFLRFTPLMDKEVVALKPPNLYLSFSYGRVAGREMTLS